MSNSIASQCKPNGFMSRTGSSTGVYKKNGEMIAQTHPVNKGSWKANEASASRMVGTSTTKDAFKNPHHKQTLTPYHPNAHRSRPPVRFQDEAQACVRFCKPRNVATYDFMQGGAQAGFERFRTSSQNYYAYDTKALQVGESNQGIVSEKTKWIHARQDD